MASLDYESNEAIDAFAAEVDRTLDERSTGAALWQLLAYWAVNGAVYTLALRSDRHWILALGLVMTAIWVVGFAVAKDRARWFGF